MLKTLKEETHGYKLDKYHISAVNMFNDIDRLINVKEELEPPPTKPYVPESILYFWLFTGRFSYVFASCTRLTHLMKLKDPLKPQ
ncbi:hypothetical protein ISN44_As11g028000 [Arabidopsis suecica]|uniref:Uncharacterized protein n=1 Tax=Arabidopsis suecica TaxID=45249 RepID=A0A8T1ZDC5_ARASU|nr:hypothetical protein ISN44_As11g028000 [Arabidopsis suecica]